MNNEPFIANEILAELRTTLGNAALVSLMEARDRRLASQPQETASLFLQELQDSIYHLILQTSTGLAEIEAFEDERIEERRNEPGGVVYLADKYLEVLEKRISELPE